MLTTTPVSPLRASPREHLSSRLRPRDRSREPDRPRRRRRGSRECRSGRRAILTWLKTAPPFCARPAMSITPQPLPSRCAAMPRMRADGDDARAADAGDEDRRRAGSRSRRIAARGSSAARALGGAAPFSALRRARSRTTGKSRRRRNNPCCSSIGRCTRLRPNSVSSGCTETQFDLTPQSPQPSQTRSLMKTRLSGSGYWPRLRRRRFSAAQVWS